MYNATNDATWLSAPQRFATRLSVLRRAAIQRYDLFVNLLSRFGSTRRNSACLIAPQFNATICLLLRDATWLIASLRSSAQLNDLFVTPHRGSPLLNALNRNATQRFVYFFSRLNSQRLGSPRRGSPQLNDLFVTTPLHAARLFTGHHGSLPRTAPQLNSTICLSIYYRTALLCSARHLSVALRFATICLSIYYRTAALLYSALRSEPQFNATICLLRRNDDTALLSDTHFIAPLRKTTLLNSTQRTET